jgi:hypothetical protein
MSKIAPNEDIDKKPPTCDVSIINPMPPDQDDIITKAKYRYGRKSSSTPSTFKK